MKVMLIYKPDTNEEIVGNNYARQNKQCVSKTHPTVIHNPDGPNVDPSLIERH